MKSNTITLSPEEMAYAAQISDNLHNKLRRRGIKDGHGLRKEDATKELEHGGSQSELAAAKFYGVDWSASLPGHDKFGPDIGCNTQVRSSNKPRDSHHLIVRDKDWEKYGDCPFILVIQEGNRFIIKGWASSREVLEKGRHWDGGDPQRPSAYFLHESKLHSPDTLPRNEI